MSITNVTNAELIEELTKRLNRFSKQKAPPAKKAKRKRNDGTERCKVLKFVFDNAPAATTLKDLPRLKRVHPTTRRVTLTEHCIKGGLVVNCHDGYRITRKGVDYYKKKIGKDIKASHDWDIWDARI